MSEPVPTVEIEDVLSSIRRLVGDGDKARTYDPAPAKTAIDAAQPRARQPRANRIKPTLSKPGKLLLTPAYLVVNNDAGPAADQKADRGSKDAAMENSGIERDADDQETGWVEELPDNHDAAPQGVLRLYDRIDTAKPAPKVSAKTFKTTDRSDLIASIAELEAAVSKELHNFEPDGSETEDEVKGEQIVWPASAKRNTQNAQNGAGGIGPIAEPAQPETFERNQSQDAQQVGFELRKPAPKGAKQAPFILQPAALIEPQTRDQNGDGGESPERNGVGGTADLDTATLRALVSDVVREELAGQMGERITRNIRKLVRREVYRILATQDID